MAKLCYTYDNLSRVTVRRTINLSDQTQTRETYAYDAAGNITCSSENCSFRYGTNNRLTSFNGMTVSYDSDGNMVSAPLDGKATCFQYDSANRLISAGDNCYLYNAEDVRVGNLCGDDCTFYTYNTNAKLSQLLQKTTNGVVTKYVYGLGLIGEEKQGQFKTYHFDYRGSTVAITNENGVITDTFEYDTYGRMTGRTGGSFVIFGYNGRDGVITDRNGLLYMRARYYSPELNRFVNADIVSGSISNAITLNRYAYANGNPVSNVDPFGLSAERGGFWKNAQSGVTGFFSRVSNKFSNTWGSFVDFLKLLAEAYKTPSGPSVLEAAYMADHIYDAVLYVNRDQNKVQGGWELLNIIRNDEGLKMGIYAKEINGTINYTLVNKGTSTLGDWVNNFQQPFGWSDDMIDSIKEAKKFVESHPGANITFVGHSKGGAEAAANAVATNQDAILFNPASVNLEAYGLNRESYNEDMTAYIVKGEILNNIFGGMSTPIDEMKYLPTQEGGSIDNHMMEAVINALEEKGYQ